MCLMDTPGKECHSQSLLSTGCNPMKIDLPPIVILAAMQRANPIQAQPHRMSGTPEYSFDYQFELLMELHENGEQEEAETRFVHLLRDGAQLYNPLADFLLRQPNEPRVAILIELLAKTGDQRAVPILMRFLDISVAELRFSATVALGWLRAPAALEKLDRLEANDPEPTVREEARLAIDEILDERPALASLLHHHQPLFPEMPKGTATDDSNASWLDVDQLRHLRRVFPRLLASRYAAVPLHFRHNGTLLMAVPAGQEATLRGKLAELTGHHVELRPWTKERINQTIQRVYIEGDDDFCQEGMRLTPSARKELTQIVLEGLAPDEPLCPLDEANDGVEALISFLSTLVQMDSRRAIVESRPTGEMILRIGLESRGQISVVPPTAHLRECFLRALLFLAGIEEVQDGAAGSKGVILPGGSLRVSAAVLVTRRNDGEVRAELSVEGLG